MIYNGIRSGEDVLKAIASGTETLLVGPMAAVGGESEGFHLLCQQIKVDLRRATLIIGCSVLLSVGSQVISESTW